MNEPVIISAVRTPVGRYMGALKEVHLGEGITLNFNRDMQASPGK